MCPLAASARAVASPIPDEAPATTATRARAVMSPAIKPAESHGRNSQEYKLPWPTAPLVCVEGIDGRQFIRRQLEVEHVEVLGDSVGLGSTSGSRTGLAADATAA